MTAPDVTVTINNGGVGVAPASGDKIHVKLGVASGLTANTLYGYSNLPALIASGAVGPAVDAAAVSLNTSVNGVGPALVYIFPVTPSTAATSGSVTVTRTSTSTGTVATTGSSPKDSYSVQVIVTTTGTLGAGAFKISFDGGDTFSAPITIPGGGTYTSSTTGVVVVFTPGSGTPFFEAGDSFTWSTVAPAMTTSDIATAVAALLLLTPAWEGIHVVGAPADHTATATLFSTLATQASALEAVRRYRWIYMEASDSSTANLITATAALASDRVFVGAGWEELYIPTTKMVLKRPSAWVGVSRLACIDRHIDPAKVKDGPVQGIVPNTSAPINGLYYNEDATPGLDSGRFSTLRQFSNNDPAGVYITNVRCFSTSTSDYQYAPARRVMDRACELAVSFFRLELSDDVNVEVEGDRKGFILESDALQIENSVQTKMLAVMGKMVSSTPGVPGIRVRLGRSDLLLTTATLTAKVDVVPKGYFKAITVTIGLVNPAFQPGAV